MEPWNICRFLLKTEMSYFQQYFTFLTKFRFAVYVVKIDFDLSTHNFTF